MLRPENSAESICIIWRLITWFSYLKTPQLFQNLQNIHFKMASSIFETKWSFWNSSCMWTSTWPLNTLHFCHLFTSHFMGISLSPLGYLIIQVLVDLGWFLCNRNVFAFKIKSKRSSLKLLSLWKRNRYLNFVLERNFCKSINRFRNNDTLNMLTLIHSTFSGNIIGLKKAWAEPMIKIIEIFTPTRFFFSSLFL